MYFVGMRCANVRLALIKYAGGTQTAALIAGFTVGAVMTNALAHRQQTNIRIAKRYANALCDSNLRLRLAPFP
jgi:hypothetical protein